MTAPDQLSLRGIVLAAGRSSRAGVFKPSHLHAGKPLLLHAVDALAPWCRGVVVVGGHRHALVRELARSRPDVTVAFNPDHERGMFSSVQTGLNAAGTGWNGCFVLPVDCPLVGREALAALVAALGDRPSRAIVPEWRGRAGHPVLLPPAARAAVLAADARTTLRDVVRRLGAVRVAVDDPAVLMDLDTREDLRALAGRAGAPAPASGRTLTVEE